MSTMSRKSQSRQPLEKSTLIEGLYKTTYTVGFGGSSTDQELKPLLPSNTVIKDEERSVYVSHGSLGPKLTRDGLESLLHKAVLGRLGGSEKLFTAKYFGDKSTRYNIEGIADRFFRIMSQEIKSASECPQHYWGPSKEDELFIRAVREKTHDFDGGTRVSVTDNKASGTAKYLDPDDASTRLKDPGSNTTQSITVPSSLPSSALPATGRQQLVEDSSPLHDPNSDADYGWSWSDLAELPEELKTMYGIP